MLDYLSRLRTRLRGPVVEAAPAHRGLVRHAPYPRSRCVAAAARENRGAVRGATTPVTGTYAEHL